MYSTVYPISKGSTPIRRTLLLYTTIASATHAKTLHRQAVYAA